MTRETKRYLKIFGLPLMYALLLRVFFGSNSLDEYYRVMSLTFLVGSPVLIGVLTLYFDDSEKTKSLRYQLTRPWLTCTIFLFFTLKNKYTV